MSWPTGRSLDGGLDQVPLPRSSGALWLCGKRVVGPDPEAALVRADNADTIVAFNEPHELEGDYPDYVVWLNENDGGRALWFPIPDFHAPELVHAQAIVAAIIKRLEVGEGLILHCAGGIGRAPTMGLLVLMSLGMGLADATAHIRSHRPMGGPEVGAQHDLVAQFAKGLEN